MSRISLIAPIGTKLGSFIVNDQLEVQNAYHTLAQYEKLLKSSIDIGLYWLQRNVPILDISKYKNLLTNVEEQFSKNKYTESLNQRIIELSYDVLSKLNSMTSQPIFKKHIDNKIKTKPDNHLGTPDLNKILLADVNTEKYIMVETHPGNFVLCFYVKHNDHWDILPYKYIADKIDNFCLNL